MLAKAILQNNAVAGTGRKVEYHFAQEKVANLVRHLFQAENLDNIIVIWTKPIVTLTPATEDEQ